MRSPATSLSRLGVGSTPLRRHALAGLRVGVPTIILLQFLVLLLPREVIYMPLIYASPWLTVLALASMGFKLSLRSLGILAGLLATSLIVAVLGPGSVLNVALSVATYGSALLLALAPKRSADSAAIATWSRSLLVVAGILLVYGLGQMVRAGFPLALPYRDFSPDVFAGPYGRGGPRLVTMLFVPAFFQVTVTALRRPRLGARDVVAIGVLLFAIIAPGSNATILAFGAAIGAYLAQGLARRVVGAAAKGREVPIVLRVRSGIAALLLVGALVVTVGWFVLGSTSYLQRSLSRFTSQPVTGQVSPKAIAAWSTLSQLPVDVPWQPAVGIGLGNYSSWSQLLLSGVYVQRFLFGRVSSFPVSVNDVSWNHVLFHISPESYAQHGRFYVESVSTQPWFSWQSLYGEIGVLGLLLVGVLVAPRLRRLRLQPTDPEPLSALKVTLGLYVWFAVFMGFVDNYFEYPWLLAPLLLGLALVPRPSLK